MSSRAPDRLLHELLALEREIIELDYVRRSDALELVRDAVRRLGEVGSPTGILDRAVDELGANSEFDRVLISEVRDRTLLARSLWTAQQGSAMSVLDELRRTPVVLEYPLIEAETARRQAVTVVQVAAAGSRTPPRLADVLGWDAYVVGSLVVDGNVVGLLHADAHHSGRALDSLDIEVVARFAEGLAAAFERAVLRDTLQRHRTELQAAVQWMSGRLSQLAQSAAGASRSQVTRGHQPALDALTPRELEVLRLMARGRTNLAIANALVVREGTIKYHVKNILRKLGASSRADAVARYARMARSGARA